MSARRVATTPPERCRSTHPERSRGALLLAVALLLAACSQAVTPHDVGKACAKHDECKSLPEGYCAKAGACTRECSLDGGCPEGTVCSQQGHRAVCLVPCETSVTCVPALSCLPVDVGRVCTIADPLAAPLAPAGADAGSDAGS